MSQSRQPKGIPVGGQFATGTRAEQDTELGGRVLTGRKRIVSIESYPTLFHHHMENERIDPEIVDLGGFAQEYLSELRGRFGEGVDLMWGAVPVLYADHAYSEDELRKTFDTALREVDIQDIAGGHIKRLTPTELPEGLDDSHRAWAEAALADGWRESPKGGPWGKQLQGGPTDPDTKQVVHTGERHEGDRSVALRKDDMVIYLVDRDSNGRRQVWTAGWMRNGLRSFDVPAAFDAAEIERLRGCCLKCGKEVGTDQLQSVGFAGAYCADCAPDERRKQEFPGWAN